MKLTKYNNYKNTNIQWLGDIPEHWEVKRIKQVFTNFGSGTTPKSSNEAYYEDGNINWLNTSDLNNGYIETTKFKISKIALKELALRLYPINTLAIAMYGQGKTRGTVGLLKAPSTTNQASCMMYGTKIANEKFILWWFIHKYEDIRFINIGATQPNMNQDFVRQLLLQLPPLSEQTAIANYLDQKTAQVDKKVDLLSQKIEKYKELKKSLINETVCRGLDKNINIKPSGIDWIGDIPDHWEVKRLKDLGEISTSSVNKKIQENEAIIKLVNYTDVYGNQTKELRNSSKYMQVSANELQIKYKNLLKGDVLFTPSSETVEDIGVSAVVLETLANTLYSYHILRLRFRLKINDNFKKYLFNNDKVQLYFSKSCKGTTRKILGLNDFNNLRVILPPHKEQTTIAQYLDEKTSKIDQITANLSQQIETLKELRKTLINEVVTGKVRVN